MKVVCLRIQQMPQFLRDFIREVANLAKSKRCALYLVGGWLRDFVLGRESLDMDFVVSGDPIVFAKDITEHLGGRTVTLKEDPSTVRVVRWRGAVPNAQADFTKLQVDIDRNLLQRDFTCNATAVDVVELASKGETAIIDPLGGLEHIAKRRLVLTSKKALQEDPVRLMRAFRLIATLKFQLDQNALNAIKTTAPLLTTTSVERVSAELAWALQEQNAQYYLSLMDKTGVLSVLLPETQELKKLPAAGYHHLDGFSHTLETVGMTERVMAGETEDGELNDLLKPALSLFSLPFGYRRTGAWALKFAALLHDIAKPQTMKEEDKEIHFYGHEKIGSEMAKKICQRLKLSRYEREFITTLVNAHMRPVSLASTENLTERALRRFWRDLGDIQGIYCVALSAADLMATKGKEMSKEQRKKHYFALRKLMETRLAVKKLSERPRLINGNEIMDRYKLSPSPIIGRALKLIEEATLNGKVSTKEEAWTLLDEMMKKWLTSTH